MGRLVDSEPYEGKDPKFSIQQGTLLQFYPAFRFQKSVEILHKCRIEMKEGIVENVIEIGKFLLALVNGLKFLQLRHIRRAHCKKEAQILLLYEIRL